jgi:hypothetical protein
MLHEVQRFFGLDQRMNFGSAKGNMLSARLRSLYPPKGILVPLANGCYGSKGITTNVDRMLHRLTCFLRAAELVRYLQHFLDSGYKFPPLPVVCESYSARARAALSACNDSPY